VRVHNLRINRVSHELLRSEDAGGKYGDRSMHYLAMRAWWWSRLRMERYFGKANCTVNCNAQSGAPAGFSTFP
jgi:hypothetical protein